MRPAVGEDRGPRGEGLGELAALGPAAALLEAMLERIDRIDADITRLSAVIERLLAPHEEPLQQAESMPGWGRRAARDVLAETGADMTRLPTPAHLASWAGRVPLDRQSGKRAGRAHRKHGNRYIGAVTGETSAAAGKTQTREEAPRGQARQPRLRGHPHPPSA
jgi:transposase